MFIWENSLVMTCFHIQKTYDVTDKYKTLDGLRKMPIKSICGFLFYKNFLNEKYFRVKMKQGETLKFKKTGFP